MRNVKWALVAIVMVTLVLPASLGNAEEQVVRINEGCGKILKTVGNTIVVRLDSNNKTHVFKNVSPDVEFVVDGNKATVYDLREGMHACAYKLETMQVGMIVTIEEHEIATVVDTPDKHDTPPPAPVVKPAPKPVALPHTGSSLPLAGLVGLMLLALSTGIAVYRRF